MAFLSNILNRHFTASRGVQGIQGTSNSTQGVQGIQGVQGLAGLNNGTLITNTQPGSYTLQASDVGEVVSGVSTVDISSNVFKPGENIVILNNDLDGTILNVVGKSPVVSIYEAGVGIALTENKYVPRKSFISIFCTRLNEFIINGKLLGTLQATGGTIIDSAGYRIHVFTGTGPFNVSNVGPKSNTVEYVVVAGGGGGARLGEGGGGAGGFRTGTNFPVTVRNYTITIGGGGSPNPATGGSDSVFDTITSSGGGFGGGGNGGSGGGGGFSFPPFSGGLGNRLTGTTTPAPTQGNDGGNGIGSPSPVSAGGGGGGASNAGSNASPTSAGNGGNGTPVTWVPASYGTASPLGPGRWFAGGGGGGTPSPSLVVVRGLGGAGGGGNGGNPPANAATPGTTNTGGGGGGGSPGSGLGGSGIVIIRYPII